MSYYHINNNKHLQNSFWSLKYTDVYTAISWDRLHAYHGGLFSHHLWDIFKEIVNNDLGKKFAKLIDTQWVVNLINWLPNLFVNFELITFHIRNAEIPCWSGLTHFNTLMKTSDYTDGRKYEDISKVFNITINDVSPY